MPVSNESNKIKYVTDGAIKSFDFNFKFFNTSDIEVSLIDDAGKETLLAEGIGYDITSQDKEHGGVVELKQFPPVGFLLIRRVMELDQDVYIRPVSGFPEEVITDAFDKAAMIDQQQQEEINRSIKVGAGEVGFNPELPKPEPNKAVIVNPEGNGFIYSKNDFDNIVTDAQEAAGRAEASAVRAYNSETNAKASEIAAKASADFAETVVDGFDAHAAKKQGDFDNNYDDKLVAFNINVIGKQKDFDDNAKSMTDGFNQNVMLKIDDFDAHAMEKEIAFDDNASAKQALVDASAAAAKQSENNAKNSENVAGISETNSRESERKSRIWAEGDDPDVIDLGGTHSAKGWAEIAEGAVSGEGLVTIDTDQEITGHKTFTMDLGSKSNELDIRVDRNKRGNGLIFIDKNGTQTAGIGPYVNNNGSPEVRLIASNGTQSAFAGLGTTQDGQGFFWGPEPAEGANNEDYVTSHWVQRELTKNYVAKKGDTMTGALNFGTSGYIEANKSNSTKGLAMFGSIDGYAQGASLALRDNTAEGAQAGAFKLETGNNVTGHTHTLQGSPDGSFTCDGKEIIRSINGEVADSTGNIEVKAGGLAPGMFIEVPATQHYAQEGTLYCDNAEYTRTMFLDFYDYYLKPFGTETHRELIKENDKYKFEESSTGINTVDKEGKLIVKDYLEYITKPGVRVEKVYFTISFFADTNTQFDLENGHIFITDDGQLQISSNTSNQISSWIYKVPLNKKYTIKSVDYNSGQKIVVLNENGEEIQPTKLDYYKNPLGNFRINNISSQPLKLYECKFGITPENQDLGLQDIVTNQTRLDVCTYEEQAQEIATTGESLRFAIDEVNQKFRVPLRPDKLIAYQEKLSVQGNGMTLGITDGTNNGGLNTGDQRINANIPNYGKQVGEASTQGNLKGATTLGITTDPEKSGIEANVKYKKIKYYVVVSNAEINQSRVDWEAWANGQMNKADKDLANANPSQNFIEKSISWDEYDYDNGINITETLHTGNKSFTAPKKGIVKFYSDSDHDWEINSTPTAPASNDDLLLKQNGGNGVYMTNYLAVGKGQTIYSVGGVNGDNATFFPVKGAN